MSLTSLPATARAAGALLAVPADSVIAELASVEGPRARLEACSAVLGQLDELTSALRPARQSLVYAGADQFSVDNRACRVRLNLSGQPAPDGRRCATWPYHSRGLCAHHYQQFTKQGVPWGAGGLFLASAPVRPEGVRWRAKALQMTGITHYLWLQMMADRVYPAPGGGWTHDPALAAPGTSGYWRKISRGDGKVVELPTPPRRYGTSDEHWAATGTMHRQIQAAGAVSERVRWEVRDPALRGLFGQVSSNVTLAEWAGVSEDVISGLKRGIRGAGSRSSGRRREGT